MPELVKDSVGTSESILVKPRYLGFLPCSIKLLQTKGYFIGGIHIQYFVRPESLRNELFISILRRSWQKEHWPELRQKK